MFFDISELLQGVEKLSTELNMGLALYSESADKKLEGYMKANANWVDRTAMARQTLRGTSSKLPQGYRITLSHGVNYGVWLELAKEKKYAIIGPTINTQSAEVILGLRGILK
jgi:hypothetical protein